MRNVCFFKSNFIFLTNSAVSWNACPISNPWSGLAVSVLTQFAKHQAYFYFSERRHFSASLFLLLLNMRCTSVCPSGLVHRLRSLEMSSSSSWMRKHTEQCLSLDRIRVWTAVPLSGFLPGLRRQWHSLMRLRVPLEFGGFRFLFSEMGTACGTGLCWWKTSAENSESTSFKANGLSLSFSIWRPRGLRMGNHAGKRDLGAEKGNKVRSEPAQNSFKRTNPPQVPCGYQRFPLKQLACYPPTLETSRA